MKGHYNKDVDYSSIQIRIGSATQFVRWIIQLKVLVQSRVSNDWEYIMSSSRNTQKIGVVLAVCALTSAIHAENMVTRAGSTVIGGTNRAVTAIGNAGINSVKAIGNVGIRSAQAVGNGTMAVGNAGVTTVKYVTNPFVKSGMYVASKTHGALMYIPGAPLVNRGIVAAGTTVGNTASSVGGAFMDRVHAPVRAYQARFGVRPKAQNQLEKALKQVTILWENMVRVMLDGGNQIVDFTADSKLGKVMTQGKDIAMDFYGNHEVEVTRGAYVLGATTAVAGTYYIYNKAVDAEKTIAVEYLQNEISDEEDAEALRTNTIAMLLDSQVDKTKRLARAKKRVERKAKIERRVTYTAAEQDLLASRQAELAEVEDAIIIAYRAKTDTWTRMIAVIQGSMQSIIA